jgi:hypothetical protein
MPWRCIMYRSWQAAKKKHGFVPVGAMWPMKGAQLKELKDWLSPQYFSDHAATRKPLFVKLPEGSEFCVDSRSSNGEGWIVSGAPPKVTVSPSIHIVGRYHGYIRDGVITDDVEGRTFPDAKGVPDA